MKKLFLLVIILFFGLGLTSCSKKKLGYIDFYNKQFSTYESDQIVSEINPKTNREMYYFKAPESSLVFDRNVIFIGEKYTIDIDLGAILKEDGGWDSYEFTKIDPSSHRIAKAGTYYNHIEFDSINENAFDIERNYLIGKELGHYGVYLILSRGKEKRNLYIGDYLVTDEEYSNFKKISTAEDWFSLDTRKMKYCILANDIKLPKPDKETPGICATFLINPNHYVIDFGGYEYKNWVIGSIEYCYLEDIIFQNIQCMKDEWVCVSIGNTFLKNVSFLDVVISCAPDEVAYFASSFCYSKLKGVTMELELYSDNFKLTVINPMSFPCVYEDVVIMIKPQVEKTIFEFPVCNFIDHNLFKNVLVVNTNKENNLILTLMNHTSRDKTDVYVSEGLKKQIINVYGVDCEIFYKDLEKGNWYFNGNK